MTPVGNEVVVQVVPDVGDLAGVEHGLVLLLLAPKSPCRMALSSLLVKEMPGEISRNVQLISHS